MSGIAPAYSFTQWLTGNIGSATRWRDNTPYGDGCDHDCEGGVDIDLPANTPIYNLATGALQGAGTFTHPNGNPGYGVVTILVPGVGDVYYQHLDLAPGIPICYNGNCNGVVIPAGTLLGWIHPGVNEIEVGINPGWGGIWGPNPKPGPWVGDPRATLVALAGGSTAVDPAAAPKDCKSANAGSCGPCSGGFGGQDSNHCLVGEYCEVWNSDGTVYDAPLSPGIPNGVCVSGAYRQSHQTSATNFGVGSLGFQLPDWLAHPDWLRLLKVVAGALGLVIGIGGLFFPQISGAVSKVAEVGLL